MSFLFGKKEQQQPMPTPAAPRISDAMSEASAREERVRTRRKKGIEDTILTKGLGDASYASSSANPQRTGPANVYQGLKSLLGGGR